jgi:hypothetical protein
MGQEEPDPIQPEGEDPGTEVAEGDQLIAEGDESPQSIEPEGEDPGRIETFELQPENEERLNLAEDSDEK